MSVQIPCNDCLHYDGLCLFGEYTKSLSKHLDISKIYNKEK